MRTVLEGTLDILSEVLRVVKLSSALFYNAEYSAPWSFRSPPSRMLSPYVAPERGHVILYHLVTEGNAWVRLEGTEETVELHTGDVVMFPHGDAHLMGNGPAAQPVDQAAEIHRILARGLEPARSGAGGEVTRFVCGYLTCEPQVCQLLLAGLPALVRVNIHTGPSGPWIEQSIQYSVAQAGSGDAGAEAVVAKLSEALFMETLRLYMAMLPENETGWLAGARDPKVGKAMTLMHGQTAREWTVASLAAEVGVSRSVLAERFRYYLGEAPMAYLTRWRLQIGARMLTSTKQGVAEIAGKVGYESEAAFNRAFKREFGVPPGQFRKDSKAAGA